MKVERETTIDHEDITVLNSRIEFDSNNNLDFFIYELLMKDTNGKQIKAYKAIKLLKTVRLPNQMKQEVNFMKIHGELLSGLWEREINFVTVIANILTPTPIGLLFCYGVQVVSTDLDTAKRIANDDFVALMGAIQGAYRTFEYRLLTNDEAEWLKNKINSMKNLSIARGIPQAKNSPGAGGIGIGGTDRNPDTMETTEELVAGLSNKEYVVMMISSPVKQEVLNNWLSTCSKQDTKWQGQLQGSTGMNFGINIPIMFAGNLGASQGWSDGSSDGESYGENLSHSDSTSFSDSFGTNHSDSSGTNTGWNEGTNMSHGTGSSTSAGTSHSMGTGTSTSSGFSEGYSHSDGQSYSVSDSTSHGTNHSYSQGTSHSTGVSTSHSTSYGTSSGYSTNTSHGSSSNYSSGNNWGVNHSYGTNAGTNSGTSHSDTSSIGISDGVSGDGGLSIGFVKGGVGTSYSSTDTTGQSDGTSHGTSHGTSTSTGASYGGSSSSSVGSSYSFGSGYSSGVSHGVSYGTGTSEGWGTSTSKSYGTSDSTSHGTSQGTSTSDGTSSSFSYGTGTSTSLSDGTSKGTGTSISDSNGSSRGISGGTSQSTTNGTSHSTSNGTGTSDGTGTSWGSNKGTSYGFSSALNYGTSASMGIGASLGVSKTYQFVDVEVRNIVQVYEYMVARLNDALCGEGAFFTDLYIATPDSATKAAATSLSKAAWQNPEATFCPLQIIDLNGEELQHMLYHFSAFSSCHTKEGIKGSIQGYKYSSILLASELTAYTHPVRLSEGGQFADIEDIPILAIPSQMKGEIYLGKILSGERWTPENGYKTPFDYRLDGSKNMHHIFFSGESRSGKTVMATRFVVETALKTIRNGKHMRIIVLDPKQDWRVLGRFIDAERFKFFSLGKPEFLPIKLNLLRIPQGVRPQVLADGIIEAFCRSYQLGEKVKPILRDAIYSAYEEAGCFCAEWEEVAPTLSKNVCFASVVLKIKQKMQMLKDNRATPSILEAYERLLDRMDMFTKPYTIEYQLFGQGGDDAVSIDQILGDDDVTVLESFGLDSTFKSFVFGAITTSIWFYCYAHEGGFGAPDQYSTLLVIEEANEVLIGGDADSAVQGTSTFEKIVDQAAGLELFICAITQKIADMPPSIIANTGLAFSMKISRKEDKEVFMNKIGKDERIDDKNILKFLPKMPTGWCIAKAGRTFDYKDAEPVLLQVDRLDLDPPNNKELLEIMKQREISLQLRDGENNRNND